MHSLDLAPTPGSAVWVAPNAEWAAEPGKCPYPVGHSHYVSHLPVETEALRCPVGHTAFQGEGWSRSLLYLTDSPQLP